MYYWIQRYKIKLITPSVLASIFNENAIYVGQKALFALLK